MNIRIYRKEIFMYNYDFSYGESMAAGLIIFYIIFISIAALIGIAVYVFQSYSLYTIAKNRGIENPWMMWIPIANYWAIGELGDYYFNIEGAPKKNLNVIMLCLGIGCLIPCLNIICAIALLIMEYIVYYKIFQHTNPKNAVVFLVIGIIFSITMPFFLFSVRNKMDITYNQYGQQEYQQPPYPPYNQ